MTPPPACVACGEPCRQVWTVNAGRLSVAPWSYVQHGFQPVDPLIAWLCSRCVDAAAEGR